MSAHLSNKHEMNSILRTCCIENSSNSSDGLVDICYARNTPGSIYGTNIRKMVLCQGLPHCLRRPMRQPMHGMSCLKFQLKSTCLNLADITGRTALAVRPDVLKSKYHVITNATYSCHNRDPVPAKFNHVTNIETCTLLCCDHITL